MIISIKKYLYKKYWQLARFSWRFIPKKTGGAQNNTNYAFGIATYVSRYESYFKPLIIHLTSLFPDTQIVVGINGYYDPEIQQKYIAESTSFLRNYPNVRFVTFEEPQSLSKIWNLLLLNSNTAKMFILNDDVEIAPTFRMELEKSELMNREFGLINRSWSHYLISKKIIEKVGWFDQRFPELGNEDEDYESRMSLLGLPVETFPIRSLYNVIFQTVDFSYGKDIEVINTKYAKANKVFFDTKWQCSATPQEGFKFVGILQQYVKLVPGMETPDFYDKGLLYTDNKNIIK